jgi:hypothetical protein
MMAGIEVIGVYVLVVLAIAVLVALYFLPTIIVARSHHPQIAPILVVNLLLGWTFFRVGRRARVGR